MTAYIQSLLFEPYNLHPESYLEDIRDVMFTVDYKKKYRNMEAIEKQEELFVEKQETVKNQYVNIPKQKQTPTTVEYKKPKQKDTLFWCLYIAKYGYDEYTEIQTHYGTKQLEIQQKIGNYIRNNMVLLKNVNTRITKAAAQEILSELLTDSKTTSMHVLYAYAIYYNMNLILLHPSTEYYLEIQSDTMEDVDTYLLQKDDRQQFSIRESPLTEQEYKEIVDTKYRLESHLRPLKAIGNYKVDELYEVAEKVKMDLTVKRTKPELYNAITEKIKWY
jgi:hypothetical protein